MKKFIIVLTMPATLGPVEATSYGYVGVIAEIVDPHGNREQFAVESDERPIMGVILDRIVTRWGLHPSHGWISVSYTETEGAEPCSSVEVITADFDSH